MDCFTPQQTIELVSRMGAKKAHMRIDKLFINSFVAGPLLGFGYAHVPVPLVSAVCLHGSAARFSSRSMRRRGIKTMPRD